MDFKAPYNRNEYINFFRSQLLPEDLLDHSEDIAVGFKSHLITKVVKIGEVTSLELLICEVSHPSENDPRVSLSRDAFRLLAQYGAKRALLIFNSENSENFRLSLVTIDLKWEEGKRVQREYSNPRRYSFFLGPETRTHTPEEYLIKQGRVKDFDDLKGRFSIEVVNKDFYTQIAVLFTQLAGGKRTIGRKAIDAGRGLLNLPSTVDDTLDKEFTVRLIGRLVFCWFLKKKRSDKNIPLLPEELLSAKAVSENKGYYHGILEPLFFEVLNTPVDNRTKKYQGSPWSQIPFLNGGLFTPHLHDYYDPGSLGISKHINTLKVPDSWIKELFEVFETYNFTIDENTSIDVELSIEPEMLGRIFENLLAEINPETGETARKATGSYYTPRPIVEYMVDESLKQYLLTKTKLDESTITRLLTYEDVEIKLAASEKESILSALDAIKIIDPACGSGAFPMGILQKMLLILQKVDPESEWWLDTKLSQIESKLLKKELGKKLKAENVNYVHKLGIIQSSIYGVDIQPIAVEISKLRFFLSLIVDENVDDSKENRGIEPLPNLEFKFVCANSLIGLPKKDSQQTLFEATDDIALLKDLRDEYLRSYGSAKKKVEKKFLEVQSKMAKHALSWALWGGEKSQTMKLSQWDPFSEEPCGWFDPEWMFGVRDGFNIAIGNPPYFVLPADYPNIKYFEEQYTGSRGGKKNLYKLFFECALKLIRNYGVLAFITPSNYLTSSDSIELRRLLINESRIVEIIEYSEADKVFEAVTQAVCTIILVKSKSNDLDISYIKNGNRHLINQKDIISDPNLFIKNSCPVILRMKKQAHVLNEYIIGYQGEVNVSTKKKLFTKSSRTGFLPLVRGNQIRRHSVVNFPDEYCPLNAQGRDHCHIKRIVFQEISNAGLARRLNAVLLKDVICGHTTNYIFSSNSKVDIKFILALINSSLFNYYFKFYNQTNHVPIGEIKQIPVPDLSKICQDGYIQITDRISKTTPERIQEYESQIDNMVYELYGLTKKEIEIVEKSLKNE